MGRGRRQFHEDRPVLYLDRIGGHAVVVPTFQGRLGHPVGFASGCFTALAALAGDAGAKAVVQAHRRAGGVLELPVADPGIVLDIDRLDDLRAAERRLAEGHG